MGSLSHKTVIELWFMNIHDRINRLPLIIDWWRVYHLGRFCSVRIWAADLWQLWDFSVNWLLPFSTWEVVWRCFAMSLRQRQKNKILQDGRLHQDNDLKQSETRFCWNCASNHSGAWKLVHILLPVLSMPQIVPRGSIHWFGWTLGAPKMVSQASI